MIIPPRDVHVCLTPFSARRCRWITIAYIWLIILQFSQLVAFDVMDCKCYFCIEKLVELEHMSHIVCSLFSHWWDFWMSSSPISFNKSNKEKLEKNQRFHLQDRSCKHKKIESFPNITHPNLIVCLSESYYYYCSSVTLRGPPEGHMAWAPEGHEGRSHEARRASH